VIPNRPSRLNRFALSSKLFEYVSLGIPVVVSRLETLAAHFDADEVTFFESGDVEALAEAIAWVAEHPAEARAKAERAQLRAEAYSWSASRARLVETLSHTASEARAQRRSSSRHRPAAGGPS
jgi:glycosyltransferase involved in cell wall biosynthesis